MKISKILTPIDFSNISDHLIQYSIDFAKKFDAELFYIHVIDERTLFNTNYNYFYPDFIPPITIDQEFINKLKTTILKKFNSLLKKYNKSKLKINNIIEVGIPNSIILETINRLEIDFVIIGNQGLTGLQQLFLGSTSDYIVHHAKVPVLIVKI